MLLSFNAMPAKITKKNGQFSLVRFAWYLLHNPRLQEHFCVQVNRAVTMSLRQGYAAANMSMTPSYFHRKQKGNQTRRDS